MKHEMPTLFWALAKQVCGLVYNTNGRTKSKYTYICCANEKCARVSDLLHITFSVNWSYSFGIMPAHVYPLLLVKLSMLEFSANRTKTFYDRESKDNFTKDNCLKFFKNENLFDKMYTFFFSFNHFLTSTKLLRLTQQVAAFSYYIKIFSLFHPFVYVYI